MIRTTILWLSVAWILTYSWKDWYRGLCGLIAFIAIMEHPDVPKQMLGIPGLNPFNLLLGNVLAAWWSQRTQEGCRFDMPRNVAVLLILSVGVVFVGFLRMFLSDTSFMQTYYGASRANLVSDYLINTIKFAIPGLLLYDGCRTEERFRLAVLSVLAVYVLLAIQVAKWMPPTYALDADALSRRGLRVLASGMGFHRVNLSAMLSGASWAILSARVLLPRGKQWIATLVALFVIYAQVMTGGRAGYMAWIAVGFAMSTLKWRRYLLLVPVALSLVVVLAPGVVNRALAGFTEETRDSSQRIEQLRAQGTMAQRDEDSTVDAYTVTAGRSVAWPRVIEKIKDQPWIGYGRQAMLNSGLALAIYNLTGEAFPHPHNAYLEIVFDNGILGGAPIVLLHVLLLLYSIRLFVSKESPTCIAIGGISTAFLLSLFVSGLGSQSFYPEEGWLGMWCAMFLMLRVRVERQRLMASAPARENAPPASVPSIGARPLAAPAFVPAHAGACRTQAPQGIPPLTWRPRNEARPAENPGRDPAPVPVARRRERMVFRPEPAAGPVTPARPVTVGGTPGITLNGWFGSSVSDRLVWERA